MVLDANLQYAKFKWNVSTAVVSERRVDGLEESLGHVDTAQLHELIGELVGAQHDILFITKYDSCIAISLPQNTLFI